MTVKPLEDRVLVKPIEAETRTASGLYLPETAKEKPMQGKVVAAGPGKLLDNGKRATLSIKTGDTVVFGKYAGTDVTVGGKELKIMRERDILAKIKG
ncbi:MAG: co-chaperone GroES [Phycisphaerales bacterium]|nr:co-chaperone GroES [Phycisphaerales bacterium]